MNGHYLILELVGNILGLDSRGREVSLLIKIYSKYQTYFFRAVHKILWWSSQSEARKRVISRHTVFRESHAEY